ncbi:MAG TPA: LUD domain-containing protein [Rhizomicrobium sp.]|nr:LUD domain-containing protein [Rhizomicrobium sp.]
MNARDDILANIRARKRASATPELYRAPFAADDLVAAFTAKAQAVNAEVRIVAEADIAATVAEILRAHNRAARVHLPPESDVDLPIEILRTPPGPDDTAVTRVSAAIAETGTLVQLARPASPASWHFRPGFEIAILHANDIVARFEDIKLDPLPPTVNLITGPSRTGDIEQTLELGAHGPKELAILIVS